MAGFGFDAGSIAAEGRKGDMYLVVQVVLTEKFIGTGSGVSSLTVRRHIVGGANRALF